MAGIREVNMVPSILLVQERLVERAHLLDSYTLKRELRLVLIEREVAELGGIVERIAYLQSWFEALAQEAGLRGVTLVEQSEPANGYRLSVREIKSRLDLAEYIGRFTDLHKQGIGRFVGICPIHHESHASLFVYTGKVEPDWYCFGCLKGGDLVSFVEAYYRVTFYKALELLSGELNG